jgi:hypothetical protein
MAPRGLFDRAPLGGHCFFLRLAISSRPTFDRLGHMQNFRTTHTDFSLLWVCIGIHEEMLALLVRDKKDGDRSELEND